MRRFMLTVCTALALASALGPCHAEAETQQPPAPELRPLPDAPKVGERMPDFTVTDQNGKAVSFHQVRGDRKAYLLIARSASW